MSQSFAKHTQWTPGYHFFASPLSILYLGWSLKRFVSNMNADTGYALVGALALFGIVVMSRMAALRVQDRLIRLEERLRLARVLPADLQSRIEELRPSHLVALRFAPDHELTDLVRKVLADPSIKSKEIKRQIVSWRPDYLRA